MPSLHCRLFFPSSLLPSFVFFIFSSPAFYLSFHFTSHFLHFLRLCTFHPSLCFFLAFLSSLIARSPFPASLPISFSSISSLLLPPSSFSRFYSCSFRFPPFCSLHLYAFEADTNSLSLYLAGLDPTSRTHVLALLEELHGRRAPRIIIGMRAQEELPGWVTHVLNISEGGVTTMTRERWRGPAEVLPKSQRVEEKDGRDEERAVRELIVDLKGVGVKYGNRTVSKFSSARFLSFIFFAFCFFSFLRWFSQVFRVFRFFSRHFFLPLCFRDDLSTDDAMSDRFLRILRGRFVKARGGIYKGRMVGTFFCAVFFPFDCFSWCFNIFSSIFGWRNLPLHIFPISSLLVC